MAVREVKYHIKYLMTAEVRKPFQWGYRRLGCKILRSEYEISDGFGSDSARS
jgi:hypothetical protein